MSLCPTPGRTKGGTYKRYPPASKDAGAFHSFYFSGPPLPPQASPLKCLMAITNTPHKKQFPKRTFQASFWGIEERAKNISAYPPRRAAGLKQRYIRRGCLRRAGGRLPLSSPSAAAAPVQGVSTSFLGGAKGRRSLRRPPPQRKKRTRRSFHTRF